MGAAAGAASCQGTSIGAPPSPGVGGRIQGARAWELEERSSRRATMRSKDPISVESSVSVLEQARGSAVGRGSAACTRV